MSTAYILQCANVTFCNAVRAAKISTLAMTGDSHLESNWESRVIRARAVGDMYELPSSSDRIPRCCAEPRSTNPNRHAGMPRVVTTEKDVGTRRLSRLSAGNAAKVCSQSLFIAAELREGHDVCVCICLDAVPGAAFSTRPVLDEVRFDSCKYESLPSF